MTVTHAHTYCRICEALCGYVATAEDGVLIQMRPDKDHPVRLEPVPTMAPAEAQR